MSTALPIYEEALAELHRNNVWDAELVDWTPQPTSNDTVPALMTSVNPEMVYEAFRAIGAPEYSPTNTRKLLLRTLYW